MKATMSVTYWLGGLATCAALWSIGCTTDLPDQKLYADQNDVADTAAASDGLGTGADGLGGDSADAAKSKRGKGTCSADGDCKAILGNLGPCAVPFCAPDKSCLPLALANGTPCGDGPSGCIGQQECVTGKCVKAPPPNIRADLRRQADGSLQRRGRARQRRARAGR